MSVLYVDPEHDQVALDAAAGHRHRAKVAAATERIAAASGTSVRVERFAAVSPSTIAQVAPLAVVIGGCTSDWAYYDLDEFAGLLSSIRGAAVPILGICAGHQLIGLAHGAPWGPLGTLATEEDDPDPRFAPGMRKERGFLPVEVDHRCPLFRDVEPRPLLFQTHYWQLEAVPDGFVARARSPGSPIQAIERLDRPVFGVQFHTERFDTEHPAGSTVLRNFFAVAHASRD